MAGRVQQARRADQALAPVMRVFTAECSQPLDRSAGIAGFVTAIWIQLERVPGLDRTGEGEKRRARCLVGFGRIGHGHSFERPGFCVHAFSWKNTEASASPRKRAGEPDDTLHQIGSLRPNLRRTRMRFRQPSVQFWRLEKPFIRTRFLDFNESRFQPSASGPHEKNAPSAERVLRHHRVGGRRFRPN